MKHKYGEFTTNQFELAKLKIRRQIFFLLLIVDPNTKDDYININVDDAFQNLLLQIGGMNNLFGCSYELVFVMSTLEAARMKLHEPNLDFATYRKLILDAGAKIMDIKED